MNYAWHANYIGDFKWHLQYQYGVAFWRDVLRGKFWGPNHVWRVLKTSILNIAPGDVVWIKTMTPGLLYTIVEKSIGHEFLGNSKIWLAKSDTLVRWWFTLWPSPLVENICTWMKKWHGCQHGDFFWKGSSMEFKFLEQPQSLIQESWPQE